MTSPRILLTAWNLHAKKQFGQNFLADPSVPDMIVGKSDLKGEDIVLEIGAGLGALTLPIARTAARVYAVERDNQLVPLLRNELLSAGLDHKVTLIHDDILNVDLGAISQTHGRPVRVMGNLPYNISSQILIWLVRGRKHVDRAVFMFQKELADRIAAKVGSKDYGRLSAVIQYCAAVRPLVRVDASRFFPRPKVDSEVIEIRFFDRPEWPAQDETFLFSVIKAAFGQRRKTLKNALCNNLSEIPADRITAALDTAGIDPQRRAETLAVEEFVRLANILTR
ncbi:16S rRNA (adenine(1518)-N(6)/adenine(1519)-N(6)) -dimethyltransferase RsmA [Desulfatiferula olefinivorans]